MKNWICCRYVPIWVLNAQAETHAVIAFGVEPKSIKELRKYQKFDYLSNFHYNVTQYNEYGSNNEVTLIKPKFQILTHFLYYTFLIIDFLLWEGNISELFVL